MRLAVKALVLTALYLKCLPSRHRTLIAIRCSLHIRGSRGTAILGSAALVGMIAAQDKWTVPSLARSWRTKNELVFIF